MKILVFVEHDIIIRHFLHSHVFDKLVKQHDVVFVFPEKAHKRVSIDISRLKLGAPVRHLTVHVERLKIWQGIFLADMLRWRPGRHFAAMRSFRRRMVGPRAAMLYSVLALPGLFQLFRAWSRRRIKAKPYSDLDALLELERPAVLVHPSVLAGVFINDLVAASRSRSIPLVVLMNSWDNPSTKRAMTGQPDWLLVWGPQTRAHAIEFMGMPPERVILFGAAQFDLYRNPPRIDRETFCRRHGIHYDERILLYAGSSRDADEFSHLCMLDDAIDRGDLDSTVVIYRPHPWGRGGKGGDRILDHAWRNVRIEQTMRGYLERLRLGNPGITIPDYRDTHDLLSAVDALVSPLSTILIEGALHGKPILCFLPDEEGHFGDSTRYTRALSHFDEFLDEPSFLVGRGVGSLIPQVQSLLSKVGDERFAVALQKASSLYVATFDRAYDERLLEFIENVVSRPLLSSGPLVLNGQPSHASAQASGPLSSEAKLDTNGAPTCPTERSFGAG